MPSHDIPSTEIVTAKPGDLSKKEDDSFLSRWKKELKFDYEMELGRILQRVAKSTRIADVDKAEILIKGSSAVKALNKRDGGGGKTTNATQVVVYANDPTKQ